MYIGDRAPDLQRVTNSIPPRTTVPVLCFRHAACIGTRPEPKTTSSAGYTNMAKKLFVNRLDWAITDQSLREVFEAHGKVLDASVVRSQRDGRSRGFGFVTFVEEEDARKAVSALNGEFVASRRVVVEEARERNEGPKRR
jgi:RNA recognition motif-containing protein